MTVGEIECYKSFSFKILPKKLIHRDNRFHKIQDAPMNDSLRVCNTPVNECVTICNGSQRYLINRNHIIREEQ